MPVEMLAQKRLSGISLQIGTKNLNLTRKVGPWWQDTVTEARKKENQGTVCMATLQVCELRSCVILLCCRFLTALEARHGKRSFLSAELEQH